MNKPSCGETCRNSSVFEDFTDSVTLNEGTARRQYGAGCQSGSIACSGAVGNPEFGSFCAAELTPSRVNEHPEATWVCPAETVEDIPGYNLFADQVIAS